MLGEVMEMVIHVVVDDGVMMVEHNNTATTPQ